MTIPPTTAERVSAAVLASLEHPPGWTPTRMVAMLATHRYGGLITRVHVLGVLARLERAGLVTRKRGGKSHRWRITSAGRAVLA